MNLTQEHFLVSQLFGCWTYSSQLFPFVRVLCSVILGVCSQLLPLSNCLSTIGCLSVSSTNLLNIHDLSMASFWRAIS